MAEIKVTGGKNREVLVNGVPIPDVVDVSMFVRPGNQDEVSITIHADKFQTEEKEER